MDKSQMNFNNYRVEDFYQLDGRIKRLDKNDFRGHLTIGDIIEGYGEYVTLTARDYLIEQEEDGVVIYGSSQFEKEGDTTINEDALSFDKSPIVVPYIPELHYRKIKSVEDADLYSVVYGLLYLNPTIGSGGIIKMSNYIHKTMCYMEYSTRLYFIGKNDLLIKVKDIIYSIKDRTDIAIIRADKVIIFSDISVLSKKEKSMYARMFRYSRNTILRGQIIHNSAQLALEDYEPLVKVTRPIVLDYIKKYTEQNNTKNIVNNIATLHKHIENSTNELLSKGNTRRPLKTLGTKQKYNDFLLDENTRNKTLDEISKCLSISKTTAKEFKQITSR